jgi:glycine/D-amino acid oxidase-like deaminating enzyme/bacterioferritin-associated ferredoxin
MPRLQHDSILRQGSTCSIDLDGEAFNAIAGESIAAALAASGKLELRQDKSGVPRGLFCGMGACFECQVSVDGGPAQRACLTKVRPGMKIRSLAYRAEIPVSATRSQRDPIERIDCDVLVVGAGPAGMSAATRISEAGATVVVVDERSEPGGQFFKQLANSYSFTGNKPSDAQYRDGAVLIEQLTSTDAQVINAATVWGTFRDKDGNMEICIAAGTKSYIVHTRQLVLATGAFESVPVFPGWTMPGVMTTGAAQSLVRAYRVAPGQKILIAGNGPLNLHLAYELVMGGIDVVAVAESGPRPFPRRMFAAIGALMSSPNLMLQGIGYLSVLRKHGVPTFYGHHISRAEGDGRVRSGSIAKIGRDKRLLPGTEKQYEVDAVCVGYSLQPSNELARSLGCKHAVVAPGFLAPVRDRTGQTDIAGVFVIGDGGVLGGANVAMAEGRLAAHAVLGNLLDAGSKPDRRDRKLLRRHRRFQRSLWSIYKAPEVAPASGDTPVCRCEMVTLDTIKSLIKSGVHEMGSIKRLSRAGMGPCQGRYCQKQIAMILAELTGNIPTAEEMFASQLPIKPTLIANIAAKKPEWQAYRTVDMPEVVRNVRVAATSKLETDVLVIGAGVIGIATALFLARNGVEVMVADRNVANGQASGGNAGSLHLQLMSFDFSDETGAENSLAVCALPLQLMGVEVWRDLEREIGADFELEITGGLMLAENKLDLELLRKKAALERSCGIEVDILSDVNLREMAPTVSRDMAGAAYCAGEGKINPMLATPALLTEAVKSGVQIRENTAVIGIDYKRGKYVVTTDTGRIVCRKVVNAAGAWTANIASMVGVTLPVRTAPLQMIVTEPVEPMVKHLMALAKTHLTMKQAANGNIIIGGGWYAGYDSASNRAVTLRESIEGNLWVAQQVIPDIGQLQMFRSWATVGVMIDGGPILGEMPGYPGFFNAVGANGYTMAPFLGQITAELIRSGKRITDIQPFSVERFH